MKNLIEEKVFFNKNMSDSLSKDIPLLKKLMNTSLKKETLLLSRRRVCWLILKITNKEPRAYATGYYLK